MKRYGIFLVCTLHFLMLPGSGLMAQTQAVKGVHIKKSPGKIQLDGNLDEPGWKDAEVADQFWQQYPFDTSLAVHPTHVRMTYDDQNFYIAAECFDSTEGSYVVQSLKRDWSYPRSDAFVVYIDPFNDKTNGFSFGVNPLGAQREGLIQNGGGQGVTTDWDNRWFSHVEEFENKWVVEMAIPFKTLRYKNDTKIWRINFSRNNLKGNENSSWVGVPRNYNIASLAFSGTLHWNEPPPKAGANVSLIPYGLVSYSMDKFANISMWRGDGGMDAKVALGSAMNLDLTINPDFSHVEVDRQVANLSRFSLFFPERRQFFIENSDLFARFGFRAIRPFFSRQIGLSGGKQIPIIGGARVSGKLNNNWRVGFMNMQTEGVGDLNLRPQNYTVAAFQRQLFARSNIGAIVVNRVGFAGNTPDFQDFNTTACAEFNLASADNRWTGKAFYSYAFQPGPGRDRGANAVWLTYLDEKWLFMYNHEWVEKNYNAEVGFVPRKQYLRFEPMVSRKFYPKSGPINNHGPEVYASNYFDNKSFRLIENQLTMSYQFTFQNRSELKFTTEDWYVYLTFPFDPTGLNAYPLDDSIGYRWQTTGLSYAKDFRQTLSYNIFANIGSYYTGNKFTIGGDLAFRKQPWGSFGIHAEQNFIFLPDTQVVLTLLSPIVEISFSKSLFLTTFFQFNTQIQRISINSRVQWRFAPMSDVFFVITDNYNTKTWGILSRGITLKAGYWLTF